MADEAKEATITLSVREWLARIDAKLDTKADRAEVAMYATKLEALDTRVRTLEDDQLRTETTIKITSEHKNLTQSDRQIMHESKKVQVAMWTGVLSFLAVIGEVIARFWTGR